MRFQAVIAAIGMVVATVMAVPVPDSAVEQGKVDKRVELYWTLGVSPAEADDTEELD
ncbi:hypothetical protein N0V82_001943 [Gnomoniopsis sp. IMI 355080]|nr:hypothetical protein N0V82_001943 [Gnomoniopsis sp. IMI 355080]